MKKLLSLLLALGLVFGTSFNAIADENDDDDDYRGDPKTTFDQRENEGHRKGRGLGRGLNQSNWLVKSKGERTQVLWKDGGISQVETQAEPLDMTLWAVGSQGGSHTNYQVTYLSPTLGTAQQITVQYNLIDGTILSASETKDGVVTEVDPNNLTLAEYCTGTYGCI